MAKGYSMDTCAVTKYLNETFPIDGISFIDEAMQVKAIISNITEIEMQVWEPVENRDKAVYRDFVSASTILGIDENIIGQTIKVRKKYKLKIPDAIIAATAMVNDFTLISDNEKDFGKVHGLHFVNPATMSK